MPRTIHLLQTLDNTFVQVNHFGVHHILQCFCKPRIHDCKDKEKAQTLNRELKITQESKKEGVKPSNNLEKV